MNTNKNANRKQTKTRTEIKHEHEDEHEHVLYLQRHLRDIAPVMITETTVHNNSMPMLHVHEHVA
jgi:hypothetical protein